MHINKVTITDNRAIPVSEMNPGKIFVYQGEAYLRTACEDNRGILCIAISTGAAAFWNGAHPEEIAKGIQVTGKAVRTADGISDTAAGEIFRFEGFDGEYFIKTATFKVLKRGKETEFGPDEETAQYFSLTTGAELTESDADIIDLPVKVYKAEINIEI